MPELFPIMVGEENVLSFPFTFTILISCLLYPVFTSKHWKQMRRLLFQNSQRKPPFLLTLFFSLISIHNMFRECVVCVKLTRINFGIHHTSFKTYYMYAEVKISSTDLKLCS